MIEKRGKKYVVVSHIGRAIMGRHDTMAEAKAQLSAISIAKARKAGHRIPKPKGIA